MRVAEGAGMFTHIADSPDVPGVKCLTIELILSTAMLSMYRLSFERYMNRKGEVEMKLMFLKGIWGDGDSVGKMPR